MKLGENKKTARLAGWLYFALALTGMYGILYVPSELIISGNPALTAENIMNNELLFRSGIIAQLVCQTLFVYLVLTLYQLLKKVNKSYAIQMVALVIVSIPIAFTIMVFQIASPVLLNGADYLNVFSTDQLQTMATVLFKLYGQGVYVAQIFWGLWMIPFGLLVYHSKFMPRIIGAFLVLGGLGYVIASLRVLLVPTWPYLLDEIVTIPSAIGEFSVMFYMIIKGINQKKVPLD